jgi:hypothetical protein
MLFSQYYNLFLERRKKGSNKERSIWFHGTSTVFLREILKNGLKVDTKKKSWDEDPDVGLSVVDRTSYGGIYMTKNFYTASSSAYRTANKFGGEKMYVLMQIQPKTLTADEDSIYVVPYFSQSDSSNAYLYKILKYGTEYEEYRENYESIKNKWVQQTLEKLLNSLEINEVLKQKVINLLETEGWNAVLTRSISYITDKYNWIREWQNSKEVPKLPDKKEGEETYRSFIDKLTRLLRNISRNPSVSQRGRSLTDITFSGRNKIICIISETNSGKNLNVLYGEIPLSFIEIYKEKHGLKFSINDKEYDFSKK